MDAIIEYRFRNQDGEFWIDCLIDRVQIKVIGPFETASERQRAHDDLLSMTRSLGAKDLPLEAQ